MYYKCNKQNKQRAVFMFIIEREGGKKRERNKKIRIIRDWFIYLLEDGRKYERV